MNDKEKLCLYAIWSVNAPLLSGAIECMHNRVGAT